MLIFAALLIWAQHAEADTLRVPGDYPTIQSALNAAARGDTVLVDIGTYAERISISTPNITLLGQNKPRVLFDAPVISVATDSTKIIGIQVEAQAFGKGQAALKLVGNDLLVESCELSGGWAGAFVAIARGVIRRSHITKAWTGILIAGLGSSFVIEDCDITGNSGATAGGGIAIIDGTSTTISGCRISGNSASVAGGAIFAEEIPGGEPAHLVVERCLLYDNAAPIGAAISTLNAEVTVRSCTIVDNTVTGKGSVVDLENTKGHAV